MSERKKRFGQTQILLIAAGGGLLLFCLAVVSIKSMISGAKMPQKKSFQMVTLLPPPPPPKMEKIQPQEKVQEKVQQDDIEQPSAPAQQANDEPPPSATLGVDADAGSGSGDAFGLAARKGGRSLIGGGGGSGSIYGWYTNRFTSGLQQQINEIIRQEGGLPEGKWKTVVEIELDLYGSIKKYSIIGSSGNQKMDAAVTKALKTARFNEPMPPGMPHVLKVSFSI